MGKRLGDRKTALRRAQLLTEERERDLVGGASFARERGLGGVEPPPVVLDQLAGAPGGILDRLPVSRVYNAWRELDRPLQRREVVAERIRTAFRVEADRRRDSAEDMVAPDQDAVAQKAQVPVGVARQLDHAPVLQVAALVEQLRIDRIADERRERVTLHDQIVGHRRGNAMTDEPGRHPLRPVVASPDPLALSVVERALVDRGADYPRGVGGASDVIGVEMGDRDPLDVDGGPRRLAEAEPRVEERAVHEVAVDVLRSRGKREGQPLDAVRERYERLFYHLGHAGRV